eukprot:1184018-Prorocentrum_minimum.AAC.2
MAECARVRSARSTSVPRSSKWLSVLGYAAHDRPQFCILPVGSARLRFRTHWIGSPVNLYPMRWIDALSVSYALDRLARKSVPIRVESGRLCFWISWGASATLCPCASDRAARDFAPVGRRRHRQRRDGAVAAAGV